MAINTDAKRQLLRMQYKAAYEAYQSCAKALTEAGLSGGKPSAELLEKEANALRQLTEVRAALLALMTQG